MNKKKKTDITEECCLDRNHCVNYVDNGLVPFPWKGEKKLRPFCLSWKI